MAPRQSTRPSSEASHSPVKEEGVAGHAIAEMVGDAVQLAEERINAASLFRDYAQFVASFLYRMGAPPADIDDMVQEVFIIAHRKGGYVRGPALPRTWIASIATNVARSSRRDRTRRERNIPTAPESALRQAGSTIDPHQQLESRHALECLQRALEGLPAEHRAAFVLYEFEGESCESIAAQWGVPLGTVYSRLHVARRRVVEAYAKREESSPPAISPTTQISSPQRRSMKPPVPLLSDTTLPALLTLHVASIARERFPYDAQRGLLELQHALHELDPSSFEHSATPDHALVGNTPVGSSLIVGSTIKIALITAASLAVWGVWSMQRADQSPHVPSVQSVRAAPVEATRPDVVLTSPVQDSTAPAPMASATTLEPDAAKSPGARLVQPAESSRARREIAQLNQIKRALPANPATALRLARDSTREFPQGLLREEREVLIVLALCQLGEVGAARAGAEEFLSRYPRSSFRARMQQPCVTP
ncbi:MAG TPA: sigma-70 family RNA polymerase sigma factor [Polyangiales bacterium]|nr:sigma-70 family RNA polymerase sigma factor [Polyangiales bacterium]